MLLSNLAVAYAFFAAVSAVYSMPAVLDSIYEDEDPESWPVWVLVWVLGVAFWPLSALYACFFTPNSDTEIEE